MDIYGFLKEHAIDYERHDHPAVFTCQEAERLVPDMAAAKTKNLFLRDAPGRRHFLVVVGDEKSVDLKALAGRLESSKLSLGSADRMMRWLGVEPGSVTILALANDTDRGVEVVFDRCIAEAPAVRCHPLVNTATLSIAQDGIRQFLKATGHPLRVVDVPAR